jgi:cysteine-rich repeat protein
MDPRRATTWAALSKTLALTILLIVLAEAAEARIITIRWSNPEPTAVTGFRVYTRTAGQSSGTNAYDGMPTPVAGVYSIPLTVSDVAGIYVTATAYNGAGESALSNELLFAAPAPVCGNAVVDAGESCDDGNQTAGDGCSATCQVEEPCGNGFLDTGEQCDDGNETAGDGCSAACQVEVAVCGNGIRQSGEACDDGNKTAGDGCSATCQVETCAYGQTSCTVCTGGPTLVTISDTFPTTSKWNYAAAEITSSGTLTIDATVYKQGFGVLTSPALTTTTANDLLVAFVSSDADSANSRSYVVTSTPALTWTLRKRERGQPGDTEIWSAQAPGTLSGTVVTATPTPAGKDGLLKVIAFANATGVGVVGSANAATGAPTVSLSGLAPRSWVFATGSDYSQAIARSVPAGQTMQQEAPIGGAGTFWVQSTTAPNAPSQCSPGTATYCGDTFVQTANGETCDDGNTTAGDGCNATCQIEVAVCGNGIRQSGEACDDGNRTAGDGCSATCQVENAVCGNAVLDAGEQCDDGNKSAGDGCNATCRIEVCGNAVLDTGEQCDDGNKTAGDGCSATCQIEVAVCGNGIRQSGEACDDGNATAGDGCNATCQIEVAVCGNAVLDAGERCDDGNQTAGDGCDAQCTIELTGDAPYHLEVGGSSWTDPSSGQLWSSDQPYATGGVLTRTSGARVSKTRRDALYWTRRVGDGSGAIRFRLPVSGLGPYRVRLHFAELGGEVSASGERVFDVRLEGGVVGLTDFDVFKAAAGSGNSVVKDLYVLVGDGALDIDLVPVAGLPPMIAAIEVLDGSGAPPAAPKFRHR